MMKINKKPHNVCYNHQEKIVQPEELGVFARNRRKELGYTQEQLALIMGCSPRLIGEIERGRTTVSFQTLFDLLTGLGVDITLSVRGK